MCGTPNYIAPEIISGGQIGHSFEADVWALGVMLDTMLCGRAPLERADVAQTEEKSKAGDFRFPSSVALTDEAVRLIRSALTVDPFARVSIEEMMENERMESLSLPVGSSGCAYHIVRHPEDDAGEGSVAGRVDRVERQPHTAICYR
jgi:polo-like kinase 1